jgi:hypothetical protein
VGGKTDNLAIGQEVVFFEKKLREYRISNKEQGISNRNNEYRIQNKEYRSN